MTLKHTTFIALTLAALSAGQAHAISHGCVPTIPDKLTWPGKGKGTKTTYFACGDTQGSGTVAIQSMKLKRM